MTRRKPLQPRLQKTRKEAGAMTVGARIAQKRKELGLSQEALGEKLCVSRQAIYKWEADAALPEIEKLVALSRLFEVPVGWLLGVEEAQPRQTEPEQTFSPKEWEIIDRLTRSQELASHPGDSRDYPHRS